MLGSFSLGIEQENLLFHSKLTKLKGGECMVDFLSFGTEQETSYHFFRSIGESESEDPTLTETLARRLS